MSWLASALNVVNKVGGIAGKFAGNAGRIGKVASTVSRAANIASRVLPKAAPIINGAITAGKVLYKTGIADKLTKGGASRLVNGFNKAFGPKNTPASTAVQSRL